MVVRAVNWYRFDCDVKSCNKSVGPIEGVGGSPSGTVEDALTAAARKTEQDHPGWRVFIRIYPPYANAFCPTHAKKLDTED
jgi:hypothetical protein